METIKINNDKMVEVSTKKVYAVIYSGAYEYEPEDVRIEEIFDSYEKAREYFNKRVEEIKVDDYGSVFKDGKLIDNNYICEESEYVFEIFKEGEYCTDHETIILVEKILK